MTPRGLAGGAGEVVVVNGGAMADGTAKHG